MALDDFKQTPPDGLCRSCEDRYADSQYQGCFCIPGKVFRTGRSFLRPDCGPALKEVNQFLRQHKDGKVMVFGHADQAGDARANMALSENRARAVVAMLRHDAQTWQGLYQSENWGLRVVQEILKDLGGSFDPGPIDGIDGPQTQQALAAFQTSEGLAADGIAGDGTRAQLFLRYMKSKWPKALKDSRFVSPAAIGCGEMNPLKDVGEHYYEPNRRALVLVFDPKHVPPAPCGGWDMCQSYCDPPGKGGQPPFRCGFFRSLVKSCACQQKQGTDWLEITLTDEFGQSEPGADYVIHFADGTQASGKLDSDGKAHLENVPPGPYWVEFPTDYYSQGFTND